MDSATESSVASVPIAQLEALREQMLLRQVSGEKGRSDDLGASSTALGRECVCARL